MAQSYLLYQSALNQSALTVNKPTAYIPFKEKFNLGKYSPSSRDWQLTLILLRPLTHAIEQRRRCNKQAMMKFPSKLGLIIESENNEKRPSKLKTLSNPK